jgi:CMP-N-acetylneuraminic acid synthetase
MKILIPSRMGSKGFPFKNRKLFDFTADTIPKNLSKCVYVSTDDPFIANKAFDRGFNIHCRPSHLALDNTSPREVAIDFLKDKCSDFTVFLYLTYPQRKWNDVKKALSKFKKTRCKSLLCRFEVEVSPYMMAIESNDGRGRQVIKHDLCMRQEYLKCFEISHFVCIFKDDEINNLNRNMYNNSTYFMKFKKHIDVDTNKDFVKSKK